MSGIPSRASASVEGMCSYSNCFRDAVAKRGFAKVCAVHLKEPRKWGKDGTTYTGTIWRKTE